MSDFDPRIIIAPAAYDLIWDYVDLAPGEVAVWGYVEEQDGDLFVSEVFLVPQTADAAGVDFMTEGLPYAIERAIADDKLDQLRFCAHSHGRFGASWSKTDEEMIATIGASGTPWLVSCIFNKKGETAGRLDYFSDSPWGKLHYKFDKLDVVRERTGEYEDELIAQLEEFVKKPPPKVPANGQSARGLTRPTSKTTALLTKDMRDTLIKSGVEAGALNNHLDFYDLAGFSEAFGWEFIDDDDGNRWWYDRTGEIVACAIIPSDFAGVVDGTAITIEDERQLGVTVNS